MKQRIKLTESEIRKIIYEAIENALGPANPPHGNQPQASGEVALPRLVGDEQTNAKLANSIESIKAAKLSLGNLLTMPGQYHGLSEDIMNQIKSGVSHLNTVIQMFTEILNR